MTTAQELFLGVVTPALSDLAVGARVDEILAEDERSDGEVARRWTHLTPLLCAFYERLGVDLPVDHDAETVKVTTIEDEDAPEMIASPPDAPPPPGNLPAVETAPEPEVETAPELPVPPDPGNLPAVDMAPEPEGPPEEALPPDPGLLPTDEAEAVSEDASRVDAASHDRLQTEGTGPDMQHAARLLYDDVIWLFGINDGEGALISLERLLTIGQIDDEVSEFLNLNSEKLLGLYEGYIGPFEKVPLRGDTTPDAMPAGYLSQGALKSVFDLIDGERSIADLIDASDRPPLETCASIEQLHRARLVQL